MDKNDNLENFLNEFKNIETNSKQNGFGTIESIEQEDDNIEVSNPEQYFICTFRHDENMDGKQYIKFIKSVEQLVRTSPEYTAYIGYLRNDLGMDRCQVMQNLPKDQYTLEFHHHPFTLFTIVDTALNYFLKTKKTAQTFEVADHVMRLHYDNIIGLVPLSKTAHDLAHAGDLYIDPKQIFGNIGKYLETYRDYIDENEIKKLSKYAEMQKKVIPVVSGQLMQFNNDAKFEGKDFLTEQDVKNCNIITKSKDGK